MADVGDVIENPATGQRLTFLATARDTAGEVFRAEGAFPPGGFAGVGHIHPHQDEHFEVLAGRAAFEVDGRERVLGVGETIDVPAGTRHTFGNGGDDEMRVLFEFHPALDSTERFYEIYFGFAQEGRVDAKACRASWTSPCALVRTHVRGEPRKLAALPLKGGAHDRGP